jgi:hypothetical protein
MVVFELGTGLSELRVFAFQGFRCHDSPGSRLEWAVKGWKKAEAWQNKRSRTGLVDELVEGGLVGLDRTQDRAVTTQLASACDAACDGASDFRFQLSIKQLPLWELMFSFLRSVVLFQWESGLGGTKYTLDLDLRVYVGLRLEV